jgi:hypothetical protein
MLNSVVFVPKLAIAVVLNVQNMTKIIAENALNPVGLVLNLAVRWYQ